jgi:hypothetical protein
MREYGVTRKNTNCEITIDFAFASVSRTITPLFVEMASQMN